MITAWIGAILFFLIMALYIALVFGAPLGEFALGGRYKILPQKMRVMCAVSIVIQALAILVLLQLGGIFSIGLSRGLAKGFGYVFSAYMVLNVFMNFKSKSRKEKRVMTPVSAVIAFCFIYTTIIS